MNLPDSNTLLTYLVLSTSKLPVFPFLQTKNTHFQSMDGVTNGNGTIACVASEKHIYYQPGHGRKLTMFSSRGYAEESASHAFIDKYMELHTDREDSFASGVVANLPQHQAANSLVFIAQEAPYSAAVFLAQDLELRMYGLYTPDSALLVLTNLQNYEQMLSTTYREQFWLYRFLPRDSAAFVMFPRRICSRWFRWGQQSTLSNFAARFTVLERHLFRGNV